MADTVLPMVLQRINLDIVPGKIPPIVYVSEYDTGREIVVYLFRDGYPYGKTSENENWSIKVEGSIGQYGFSEDASWADDGDEIVFHLTEAMTAIHGRVWTKIKITDSNGQRISTCGFWMDVDRAGVNAQDVIEAKGFEDQIAAAAGAWLEEQGFTSPTLDVTEITGGHRVTVTDYEGSESFDVMDGEDTGVVTDTTLMVRGAAADAKTVGDILGAGEYELGDPDNWSRELISYGQRQSSENRIATTDYLPQSVTHVACVSGYSALLHRYTADGVYSGYWSGTEFITQGTAAYRQEFDIPQDSYRYVLVLRKDDNSNIATDAAANISSDADSESSNGLIQRVEALESATIETDKTLSVEDAPADAATVGEILYGSSEEGSGEPEEITVGSWTIGQNIDSTGNINRNYPKGAFTTSTIPTSPNTVFYYTGLLQDTNNVPLYVRVVEYNDLGNFIVRSNAFTEESRSYTVSDYCHGVKFTCISVESNMTQNIIDSCFGVAVEQNVNHKGVIERVDDLESSLAAIRLGLHTTPENSGVLNLIKRCRQMTDIKWTPAVDLPRFMMPSISPDRGGDYTIDKVSDYIGVFKAGVEYTGIPYGRCTQYISNYGITDSYVGITISIESFITAIHNKNSLISKESQGSVSGHRSIPYALVCSSLASYALNVAYTETARIPSISGMNSVGKVVDNGVRFDAKGIKLGDLLINTEVHSAVITDIVTDDDGEVTAIEISEATTAGEANPDVEGGQVGGICRRHGLSIEDFYAYWASYTLYRYSGIANIPYTPSKYVNVGDELNYSKFVDLPCMPYPGEGFVYHAGSIPNTKILVNASGFSFMRVFKDGTEISGSPFAVASGAEYVEAGFSAVGNYSAYLCNMSNGTNTKVTQKCHWSVV